MKKSLASRFTVINFYLLAKKYIYTETLQNYLQLKEQLITVLMKIMNRIQIG
jgi:hypothetical protein